MKIITQDNLEEIVSELLNGKTVVFPTETSYGLGCDATNQGAVDKIFKIKERQKDKPLLVVVPSIEMAKKYLVWNETLDRIAKKYWPGVVTVVGDWRDPTLALPFAKGREREFRFERIAGYVSSLLRRRELRKNLTKAERILWEKLRDKRMNGLRFRRQHGIGSYIVDFFQPDSKLVIELDGDVHYIDTEQVEKDKFRTKWLEESGYKVIRFDNVQVFKNLGTVLDDIQNEVAGPYPRPSLCEGEGNQRSPSIAMEGVGGGLANGVISAENTLALRVTNYPLLKSITEKIGVPLVATSANISGEGDIYDVVKVAGQFKNRKFKPDIILDCGKLPERKPSTLVSVINNKLTILRQGEVYVKIA